MRIRHHRISPRQIATVCGPPFTEIDIIATADALGLKGTYNRYQRSEARHIIAKLMAHAVEPEVVERLARAYRNFTSGHE